MNKHLAALFHFYPKSWQRLTRRDKWLSRQRPALKPALASPTTPSAAPSASSSVVGDAPSPLP